MKLSHKTTRVIHHHHFHHQPLPGWPENERLRHQPPPWWPENEPWPPAKPHWRTMRSRFSRRIGCFVGIVNLFVFVILIVVMGLVANKLGYMQIPGPTHWLVPASVILFIVGVVSLIWAGRGLRQFSAPLGDLLDAADHIAEGDYTTRVRENGFPEVRSLASAFNSMAAHLQTANEQRRNLLADVTHELRTPLTVIQGNVEGILDGVYPADESRLKSILEETQILARLVEDLRTMSLAESGALQLKKEATDLAALISETIAAFRAQADAAGVTLDIETVTDAPLLDLDPERMRQVLSNLIANALRYTSGDGSIRVRYRVLADHSEKRAEVIVEDDGAGITPEVLPHVFERFYKSRDSSGTGLGLPIAKYLVEAHGGRIAAESDPGKGTTIRILLPIKE